MLSNYYEDACHAVEEVLEHSSMISITSFNSPLASQAVLETKTITPLNEESDRANMQLYLQCKMLVQDDNGNFVKQLHPLNLVVLNSEGDTKWTSRMRSRVWAGQYPDTVALDRETGEIYLVFLTNWGIELRHFGKMQLNDLEGLLLTINENAPFFIYIAAHAMFNVIDGAEGYNHLLSNLYIQFNGSRKYIVSLGSRDSDADTEQDII